MARRPKVISVASYNNIEYEPFMENITRVRYMKYFKGTKPSFKERESTGILMGAFLSLTVGCIAAPYILLIGSHFSHRTIVGFTMLMAAATVFLAVWGFRKMTEEKNRVYNPVPDEEYDRYLDFDIKGAIVRARLLVTDKTPDLKEERDSIMDVEPVVLYSAESYSSDVNLPMLVKCGDDGFIRASNLYLMILFPTEKGMYINITYLNLLSGKAKFDRIYACPYEHADSITYEKRKYDIVTQQGKEVTKRVKSFLIRSGAGDTSEVGVDIIDYDIIDSVGGRFNEAPVHAALERLSHFFPDDQLPTKKASAK